MPAMTLHSFFEKSSLLIVIALLFSSVNAYSQSEDTLSDNRVHVEFMPYFMLSGMTGDVTIKNQTVPVNVSASDLIHHLQAGFMSRAAVSYNHWFLEPDVGYMSLGATTNPVHVAVDQWGVTLYGGYRLNRQVRVYTGLRYNNLAGGFTFKGPLGVARSGSQTWWDPVFGAQGELPLGKKLTVSAALDLGGFGVGSKIAVNAEPLLNYEFNKRFKASTGWKFFYQDYKNSAQGFEYDLLAEGPFFGGTFRW
jgi:hypothetical protein